MAEQECYIHRCRQEEADGMKEGKAAQAVKVLAKDFKPL